MRDKRTRAQKLKATEEAREMREFLAACEPDPAFRIRASAMREAYAIWRAGRTKFGRLMSMRAFGSLARKSGVAVEGSKSAGTTYIGLRPPTTTTTTTAAEKGGRNDEKANQVLGRSAHDVAGVSRCFVR